MQRSHPQKTGPISRLMRSIQADELRPLPQLHEKVTFCLAKNESERLHCWQMVYDMIRFKTGFESGFQILLCINSYKVS